MHKLTRILLVLFCLTCAVACNNGEIQDIQEQLKQHEEELQRLKALAEAANGDVSALRATIEQVQTGGLVTAVIPDVQNGAVVGYTLAFSSGHTIYVSTAEKRAPTISVKSFDGGDYYWTIDSQWLLDKDGKMVAVDDNTPLLKAEGDNWFVSLDNGRSWIATDYASGSGSSFKSIDTSNSNFVVITLADGTVLQLTTWSAHMALKNLVNQLNNNLAATRAIVDAIDQRDYLVRTTPIMEDGEVAGWYLEFSKGGSITLYEIGDSPDIRKMAEDIEDRPYITDIDTSNPSFVRLFLSDSSSIDIPRYLKNTLSVDIPSEGVIIKKNITRILDFTISGTNPEEATIYAASDGNFVTEVLRTSATTGRVTITCTRVFARGYVLLLLDSGGNTSTTKIDIVYEAETMSIAGPFDTFEYATGAGGIIIPAEGGARRLQSIYGVSYSSTWSTIDWVTMSYDSGDYIIYAQPNPYREDRYHTFYFELFGSVLVKQLGNPDVPANPYWSCELITIPADGSGQTIYVKNGPGGATIKNSPWIHLVYGGIDSDGIMTYTVSAEPQENMGITERYGYIRIDNNYTIGDISVVQLGWQRKAPQ